MEFEKGQKVLLIGGTYTPFVGTILRKVRSSYHEPVYEIKELFRPKGSPYPGLVQGKNLVPISPNISTEKLAFLVRLYTNERS